MESSESSEGVGIGVALRQGVAIARKNLDNHLSNKKRLLGELMIPGLVCAVYIASEETKEGNAVVAMLLQFLLKMYLGLLASSPVKEVVTLFITERTENYRQYQGILGVSHRTHTISNLLYLCAYMSFFLVPLFLCLQYYQFDLMLVFRFGAFVLSTCTLALALTAFFKDHKIALEIIGLLFSLSIFLPFLYDANNKGSFLNLLVMAMPNSSFTIAIMEDSSTPSFVSLALVKVYLLIYSIREFPEYYMGMCRNCCRTVARYLPVVGRQPTHLTEDFQLNEVVMNSDQLAPQQQVNPQPVAVRIEALTKSYQVKDCKINALNSLSLSIYQSQIFGLLGRNGAGKTTLVDILTGVTQPTQGSFHIASNIGICYQHEVLYEELTVDQHLRFYARIKPFELAAGETYESHIDDTIRTLGIEGERSKKVKQLSGGNKRKLSIAIAILGRPGLLIFDEPTSGLDPLSRINVWEVFSSLRRTRSTIILTTHHLDEAERLTDWICVIEKGAVLVQNTAAQIKERYGKGFHLQVCLKEGQLSYPLIEQYKTIVQKSGLKAVQLQHLPSQANLLVKPASKNASAIEFQKAFTEVVAALQGNDKIQARFHSNTLEESFIAILRDQENSSGDSLSEQPLPRDSHYQEVPYKFIKQILGVSLRNMLYQKSVFMQAILMYNMNILVILMTLAINGLLYDIVPVTNERSKPSGPNPMILLQGYTVMASAFISLPVYQKEKKIKGVLNARGVGWGSYWIGTFLFDYGAYCVNLLIMGHLVAKKEVGRLGWSMLAELGVGVILYAYCASKLFSKLKTASVWFPLMNVILSLILLPLLFMSEGKMGFLFVILKFIYPFFDLTVISMTQQMGEKELQMMEMMGVSIGKTSGNSILLCIAYYLILLICIETHVIERIKACIKGTEQASTPQKIRLDHVSKSFGSVKALQDVSYYASEERLALLGHNGAGKSTTFGLLSSQLAADSGEVFLQGRLRMPWQTRLHSAGICYQEDALWEGFLVQEVFSVASWMVPVRNSQREQKWLTESLQFDPTNTYKRVSNLSGGNKRKLCMMFALYGDPQMRLLDECSTGLDPASRLAMVDTLKSSRAGTTVFTTHSMSEAEDLCTKAVIMSKGKVLQFDLIGRMRSRHFDCCWVQVQLQQEQEWSIIKREVEREGITISGEGVMMRLEVDKKMIQKSDLLRQMITLKEQRKILNFSWIQPRLEDVYLKVTRENGDHPQADPSTLNEAEMI